VYSRAQKWVVHFAELETCKGSTWLEDTVRLFQDSGDRRAISNAEGNRVEVICVVCELSLRECLGVRLMERYLRC
jgi:hypothetical protein